VRQGDRPAALQRVYRPCRPG